VVDYDKLAATAKRLVEANGRAVTLLKANRSPETPSEPWRGPDVSDEPGVAEGGDSISGVLACFVPLGSGLGLLGMDRAAEIDGGPSLLRNVEQVALVAATSLPNGTDLAEFDAIRDGGRIWKIHIVSSLRPATTGLIWSLGVGA
jgi:hypothetical protein